MRHSVEAVLVNMHLCENATDWDTLGYLHTISTWGLLPLVALCYIGLTQRAICHISVLVVVFPCAMAKLFARSTLTHGDLHVHA